jgi:hypothetical protein
MEVQVQASSHGLIRCCLDREASSTPTGNGYLLYNVVCTGTHRIERLTDNDAFAVSLIMVVLTGTGRFYSTW